jgi:hypothetical protein
MNIKKNEMGRTCSMQGENKFLPKLRGKPQEEKLKFRPKFK